MQSPDLCLQPPLNRLPSEPTMPFLSPASAETSLCKERDPAPMSPSKWIQTMARGFDASPHTDDLLSLSLSKKEKLHHEYSQAMDPPALLHSHRTGHYHHHHHHHHHLPLHNAPALPGLSKVLAAEMSLSCHGNHNQAFLCNNNKVFDAVFLEKHALLSPDAVDRESISSMAAFSGTCNSAENDCKSTSDADASTSSYSPAPGEVASNAFKLYSQMFPAASSASSRRICRSATSDPLTMMMPVSGNEIHSSHSEAVVHQKTVPNMRDHCPSSDRLVISKRIKYTPIKEEKVFLDVKEEPYSEQFATPCNGTRSCEAPMQHTGLHFLIPASSEYKNAVRYMEEPLTATNVSKSSGGSIDHSLHSMHSIHSDMRKLSSSSCALNAQMMSTVSQIPGAPPDVSFTVPLSLQHSATMQDARAVKATVNAPAADWGKFLALSATPVGDALQKTDRNTALLPFQKRFTELQEFLKQCDEADQNDCIQSLRTLSATARSGYAVDLETRAIRLSLEEGKQMKRMKMMNVLGKLEEEACDDELGATPHGPKLPAPGIITKSKNPP